MERGHGLLLQAAQYRLVWTTFKILGVRKLVRMSLFTTRRGRIQPLQKSKPPHTLFFKFNSPTDYSRHRPLGIQRRRGACSLTWSTSGKIGSNRTGISFSSTRSGEIIIKIIFEDVYVRTYDVVLKCKIRTARTIGFFRNIG